MRTLPASFYIEKDVLKDISAKMMMKAVSVTKLMKEDAQVVL
jgi:hypothetical protein